MELDDFRSRWQGQKATDSSPLTDSQMQLLLTKRPGLVEKMQSSARLEAALTLGLMLLFGLHFFQDINPIKLFGGVVVQFVCLGGLYYYYYKLQVLGRMARVEGDVQKHLISMSNQVRRLLKGYYWTSILSMPFGLILAFCGFLARDLGSPRALQVDFFLIIAGIITVFGIVSFFPFRALIRWYVQRLYGRHLDQLEAALRELRD